MVKRMLIFEAHPDDTELAMGGTLRLLRDSFDIKIITFSCGEKSPLTSPLEDNKRIRVKEGDASARLLNAERVYVGLEDGNLVNQVDKIGAVVDDCLSKLNPLLVFTYWHDDFHTDHKTIGEMLYKRNLSNIVYWEEYSTLVFKPDVYVNINGKVRFKRKLLESFKSQWYTIRYPEVLNLDKIRGADINVSAAEAFIVSSDSNKKILRKVLGDRMVVV